MTLLIALLLLNHMGCATAPNIIGVVILWIAHLVTKGPRIIIRTPRKPTKII